MTATFALEARPQLELRVSPELIAYAGLLALPLPELEQEIDRELLLNPALERVDRAICPFCGESLAGARCVVCARPPRVPQQTSMDAALRAEPSATDALLAELRPLARSADVWILEHVIDSLDERGFLDADRDEIAARLEVGSERVEHVLAFVRRHGPAGIAAIDLRECLLLQLDRLPPEGQVTRAREVVAGHLEQLAAGRWHAIAEALGLSHDEVATTAEFIRTRLRPHAVVDLPDAAAPPPALPDIIVRKHADDPTALSIELVEPRRLGVVVASSYADADVGRLDAAARRHVETHLELARTFVRRLNRRWRTMRAVAEVAVERQREFVLHGPRFVRPLTRAEVAAELGVHESTVSRATSGRYALLPSGRIVPFACFFDAAQGPCAALAQLVADEQAPRSDSDLAAELAQLGFAVARRTVAKYRDRLGIPPHTRR